MESQVEDIANQIARMRMESLPGRTIETFSVATDADRRVLLNKMVAELTATPHADITLIANSAYDARRMLALFLDPATPHELRVRIAAFNSNESIWFDFGGEDVRKVYVFPRNKTPMPGIGSSTILVAE